MKAPRGISISTAGHDYRGDLIVNVQVKRRSWYFARLLYRGARRAGVGPVRSAWLTARVLAAPDDSGVTR